MYSYLHYYLGGIYYKVTATNDRGMHLLNNLWYIFCCTTHYSFLLMPS